jgi:hypothetical protein
VLGGAVSQHHLLVNTPPTYPPAAPPPAKKSALPWIIGGCGCLALLAVAGLGVVGFIYYARQGAKEALKNLEQAAVVPSNWEVYHSSLAKIPQKLQEHYVPFSFSYPPHFKVVTSEGNFIKVEEGTAPGSDDNFTYENFAVGYFNMPADGDDAVVMPLLIKQLSSQFAAGFAGYREVSQFEEQVAGHTGRAMLFESEFKNTPKGDLKIFGKVVLVRKPGASKGVTLVMLATTLDPEVKSVRDVGVKGDLPGIVRTFKLN